jgi:glutamyl-tRNA reductase
MLLKNRNWIFKVEKFDFNLEQAEIISENIKITTHFANHLKDDDTMVDKHRMD